MRTGTIWWWRRNRIPAQTRQSHLLHFIVSDARTDTHIHMTKHTFQMKCDKQQGMHRVCVCATRAFWASNAFSTEYFNEEFPSWLLRLPLSPWLLSHCLYPMFHSSVVPLKCISASPRTLRCKQIANIQNSICKWTPPAPSPRSFRWFAIRSRDFEFTPRHIPNYPSVSVRARLSISLLKLVNRNKTSELQAVIEDSWDMCVCVHRMWGVYTSAAIKGPFTKYRDSVCSARQWLLPIDVR